MIKNVDYNPHVRQEWNKAKSYRIWCCTGWDPEVWKEDKMVIHEHIKYLVYQLEKSPTQEALGQEKLHAQAYVVFDIPVVLSTAKKYIGDAKAHLEPSWDKDREKARSYCMKEDTRVKGPWEFGEFELTGQGKKKCSREALFNFLMEGHTLEECYAENPYTYVTYEKFFIAANAKRIPRRTEPPKVIVYWGSGGAGKSHMAINHMGPSKSFVITPGNSQSMWWDGYDPYMHKCIIFDDFNGSWFPLNRFKQLVNQLDFTAQTKGSTIKIVAPVFIFTSNKPPEKWWYDVAEEDKWPLVRRLTEVWHVKGDYVKDPTSVVAFNYMPTLMRWVNKPIAPSKHRENLEEICKGMDISVEDDDMMFFT